MDKRLPFMILMILCLCITACSSANRNIFRYNTEQIVEISFINSVSGEEACFSNADIISSLAEKINQIEYSKKQNNYVIPVGWGQGIIIQTVNGKDYIAITKDQIYIGETLYTLTDDSKEIVKEIMRKIP